MCGPVVLQEKDSLLYKMFSDDPEIFVEVDPEVGQHPSRPALTYVCVSIHHFLRWLPAVRWL